MLDIFSTAGTHCTTKFFPTGQLDASAPSRQTNSQSDKCQLLYKMGGDFISKISGAHETSSVPTFCPNPVTTRNTTKKENENSRIESQVLRRLFAIYIESNLCALSAMRFGA